MDNREDVDLQKHQLQGATKDTIAAEAMSHPMVVPGCSLCRGNPQEITCYFWMVYDDHQSLFYHVLPASLRFLGRQTQLDMKPSCTVIMACSFFVYLTCVLTHLQRHVKGLKSSKIK